MSQDLILLVGTVGAASMASIITFFTARRGSRGTVQTSEASDLWKEANNLRQWLTTEVSALRAKDEQQELLLRQQDGKITDLNVRAEDCERREAVLIARLEGQGGVK